MATASVRSQLKRLAPAILVPASRAPVRLARLKSKPVRSRPLRSTPARSGRRPRGGGKPLGQPGGVEPDRRRIGCDGGDRAQHTDHPQARHDPSPHGSLREWGSIREHIRSPASWPWDSIPGTYPSSASWPCSCHPERSEGDHAGMVPFAPLRVTPLFTPLFAPAFRATSSRRSAPSRSRRSSRWSAGSMPSAHQDGIPFSGRPAQTTWMKASLVLIGPSGLSDMMRCGAIVVPSTSSPWQRAQFRLNCFQPS